MSICTMFPKLLSSMSIFIFTSLVHVTGNFHTALPQSGISLPMIYTVHKMQVPFTQIPLSTHRCLQKKTQTPYYCIQGQLQPSPCPAFLLESTHIVLLATYFSSNPCTVLPLLMMFTHLGCSSPPPYLQKHNSFQIHMPSPLNNL